MILNTKGIHNSFKEISPQELSKCLQKFYCRQEKATTAAVRSLRAKTVIVGNGKWVKNHIFVLNYLTILVYTKTIIHLSVGG